MLAQRSLERKKKSLCVYPRYMEALHNHFQTDRHSVHGDTKLFVPPSPPPPTNFRERTYVRVVDTQEAVGVDCFNGKSGGGEKKSPAGETSFMRTTYYMVP